MKNYKVSTGRYVSYETFSSSSKSPGYNTSSASPKSLATILKNSAKVTKIHYKKDDQNEESKLEK